MQAVVSARAQVVVELTGEKVRIWQARGPRGREVVRRQPHELGALLAGAQDLEFLVGVTHRHVLRYLRRSVDCLAALQLALIALDPVLSDRTRAAALGELEGFLRGRGNRAALESVLYAQPFPAEADAEGARALAISERRAAAARLLADLLAQQDSISQAVEAWESLMEKAAAPAKERKRLRSIAVRHGVFRCAVVTGVVTWGQAHSTMRFVLAHSRSAELRKLAGDLAASEEGPPHSSPRWLTDRRWLPSWLFPIRSARQRAAGELWPGSPARLGKRLAWSAAGALGVLVAVLVAWPLVAPVRPQTDTWPALTAVQERNPRQTLLALTETAARAREAGDAHRAALALYQRSSIYEQSGFYAPAVADLREVSSLVHPAERTRQAIVEARLGDLYREDHQPAEAARAYRQAVLLWNGRRDSLDEQGKLLTALGDSLAQLGDDWETLASYRSARDLFREVGDKRGEATALSRLGTISERTGDTRQADSFYSSALALWEEMADTANVALTQTRIGQLAEREGELQTALALYRRATETAVAAKPTVKMTTLFHLAHVLSAMGDTGTALVTIEDAVRLSESLDARPGVSQPRDSAESLVSPRDLYDLWIDMLMARAATRPGFAERAFEVAEKARRRDYLAQLPAFRTRLLAEEDPATLRSAALRTNPSLRNLLERSPEFSLHTFQSEVLDSDTLLLEYHLGAERSYLWLVTPSSLESFRLPAAREIEEQAVQAVRAMSESPFELIGSRALETVSRTLLGPVASYLGAKRIVVVGLDGLSALPFAALLEAPGAGPIGAPLLLRHEVLTDESAWQLLGLRKNAQQRLPLRHDLAVIADPVYVPSDPRVIGHNALPWEQGFERLPGSRLEAESILAFVPPRKMLSAFDFNASKDLVVSGLLRDYRILHFATAARIDARYPALSALAFSQVDAFGRRQDGLLYASQIYGLDLPADLVTLTGCKTALGSADVGRSPGLVQAFLAAGARTVLGSVWDNDDQSTLELMTRFYRRLLIDRQPPAAALRAAQISMIQAARWSAPRYWAPFVLTGDWK